MKNVSLKFLLFFFISSFTCQVYAGCSLSIYDQIRTFADKMVSQFIDIFQNGEYDKKLLEYVKVKSIKHENDYFIPRVEVCDYKGQNCQTLTNSQNCHPVYPRDGFNGGVFAASFVDWEGTLTTPGKKIGVLEWEWAEDVTSFEKREFANSPKICVCSQKDACGSFADSGDDSDEFSNICDTCSWSDGQQKIKCAPLPRAPGPPPFYDQLTYVYHPQIKIVPVAAADNDYFNPLIKVIVDGEDKLLSCNQDYDQAHYQSFTTKEGVNHLFKAYKKDGLLCAKYYGSGEEVLGKPKFERCFPTPYAPMPKIVEVIRGINRPLGLRIKIKMSEHVCESLQRQNSNYDDGFCTFDVNNTDSVEIGSLVLRVVRPEFSELAEQKNEIKQIEQIVKQIIEQIWNSSDIFKRMPTPAISTNLQEKEGYIDLQAQYNEDKREKNVMLCISGWSQEPEEFIVKSKGGDIIHLLRKMGYSKYLKNYSKKSGFTYTPSDEESVNLLSGHTQETLDKIVFDQEKYISIEDNDKPCRAELGEECEVYKRIYKYFYKDTRKPFEFDPEKYLTFPIKANRAELFHADKLCIFDWQDIRDHVIDRVTDLLTEIRNSKIQPYHFNNNSVKNLSEYKAINIEAWGAGQMGYIEAQLVIDPNYPFIKVEVESPTTIKMCKDANASECKLLITVASMGSDVITRSYDNARLVVKNKMSKMDSDTIYQPGHVIITPIVEEVKRQSIQALVNQAVEKRKGNSNLDIDNNIDHNISKIIDDAINKELLYK